MSYHIEGSLFSKVSIVISCLSKSGRLATLTHSEIAHKFS
jgi:hypothetical protein